MFVVVAATVVAGALVDVEAIDDAALGDAGTEDVTEMGTDEVTEFEGTDPPQLASTRAPTDQLSHLADALDLIALPFDVKSRLRDRNLCRSQPGGPEHSAQRAPMSPAPPIAKTAFLRCRSG